MAHGAAQGREAGLVTATRSKLNRIALERLRASGAAPVTRPAPRELEVLRAAAGGASLTEVARLTGLPRGRVAALLSECYAKLGVKDVPCHHLSQDRRCVAVQVAAERGWL